MRSRQAKIRSREAPTCIACLAVAAALSCGGGGGKDAKGPGENAASAVHLVKIVYDKETYVIKGFFERSPGGFVLKAVNELGASLFRVSWNGRELEIEPAGKTAAAMAPFDLRNIAVDIWRIIAGWSKADIRRYNRYNDPDLPEDDFVTEAESENVIVKKVVKGGGSLAEARYYLSEEEGPDPFSRAHTIRYESRLLEYKITILQKKTGGT